MFREREMQVFISLLFLIIAAVCCTETSAKNQDASLRYLVTGSCKDDKICTYKYTTKQEEFGKNRDNDITLGATVLVLCNSVGIYNGSQAKEYCMEIKNAHLDGKMFKSNKTMKREMESIEARKLAGWFCFVQTSEGKVVSVFHGKHDDTDGTNFKKSIAAAFQANFKGTRDEEETDPQSKHISHYKYAKSNNKRVQKMHRSIKSKDVEEYPGDRKPREVKLDKEEDVEYESGSLKSSSGETTVSVTSKHLKHHKEAGSKTFAVKGSYKLKRIKCITVKNLYKRPRGRRNTDEAIESTLTATVDKRSAAKYDMEDLRRQIPSTLKTLQKLHKKPEDIHLASKLQRLLVLESEHGPLPGTSPVLADVLHYLNQLKQSHKQNTRDAQIKQTIYSLLAHEGTFKSQMALLQALTNGTDADQDSVIIHISFIENAHSDFVQELKKILDGGTAKSDSLILAYSALASTASSNVQKSIVNYVKTRLMQHMAVNDTTTTVHLIHALGNTGSKQIIDLLVDYFWHSSSEEVRLAAIHAMRKLTAHQTVQDVLIKVLKSKQEECFVEEIASTLLRGEEFADHIQEDIDENMPLLDALVTSSLKFTNNTHLHNLVSSYLETIDTPASHRLKELLDQGSSSKRVRRASWDASKSIYNLVASHSDRKSDLRNYPTNKGFVWGKKLGTKDINVEMAAGMFAGGSDSGSKMFGKGVAKGKLFSRSKTIGEAEVLVRGEGKRLTFKLYAMIGGNVLVNYNKERSCCFSKSYPLHSSRYRIIRLKHSIFIYAGTLDLHAELNAYLDVKLTGELCLGQPLCSGSNVGKIYLTPTVRVSPEGSATVNILSLTKIGLTISASFYYQLEPTASVHFCPTPRTCGPPLKVCAELYQEFPASHIDVKAWYKLRKVKWCKTWFGVSYPCGFKNWGSKKYCCLDQRWNLHKSLRYKLWGKCASTSTVTNMSPEWQQEIEFQEK